MCVGILHTRMHAHTYTHTHMGVVDATQVLINSTEIESRSHTFKFIISIVAGCKRRRPPALS